jgi:hypothetical protein
MNGSRLITPNQPQQRRRDMGAQPIFFLCNIVNFLSFFSKVCCLFFLLFLWLVFSFDWLPNLFKHNSLCFAFVSSFCFFLSFSWPNLYIFVACSLCVCYKTIMLFWVFRWPQRRDLVKQWMGNICYSELTNDCNTINPVAWWCQCHHEQWTLSYFLERGHTVVGEVQKKSFSSSLPESRFQCWDVWSSCFKNQEPSPESSKFQIWKYFSIISIKF